MNRRRRKKAARKYMLTMEPWSVVMMRGHGKQLPARLGRVERRYVSRRWRPERVWYEANVRISLHWALALIEALPWVLGLRETVDMLVARGGIVEAVWQGRKAPIWAAWNRYLDLAEAQVNGLGDEVHARQKAQIGLILMRARIWRQAQESVPWLRNLVHAELYARNAGYCALSGALGDLLWTFANWGELLQAEDRFDEAIDAYVALEQYDLTDKARGMVNLFLARCYQELLQDAPEDPGMLRELRDGSLQTALINLDGRPEQRKALGMLDDITEAEAE